MMRGTHWKSLVLMVILTSATGFKALFTKQAAMKTSLQTTPDDIRFAAQFDPSQAAASLSIFFSFIAVQSRINKSNKLLAVIETTKKELKSTKASLLSGEDGALVRRDTLEKKIVDLEEEWMNAITFVSLPGITLRFRVPQQASQITAIQEKEDSEEAIISMSTNQNQISEEKKELTDFDGRIIASTSTQRFLLFVGVIVISGLFSLLNMLVSDPMTSMSTQAGVPSTYRIPSDELFTLPEDAKFQ
jgi:hypothetical protein